MNAGDIFLTAAGYRTFWFMVIFFAFFIILIITTIIIVINQHGKKAETGKDELIGLTGTVKEELNPSGNIFIRGEIWQAKTKVGVIKKESNVKVIAIKGLTLIVEQIKEVD